MLFGTRTLGLMGYTLPLRSWNVAVTGVQLASTSCPYFVVAVSWGTRMGAPGAGQNSRQVTAAPSQKGPALMLLMAHGCLLWAPCCSERGCAAASRRALWPWLGCWRGAASARGGSGTTSAAAIASAMQAIAERARGKDLLRVVVVI